MFQLFLVIVFLLLLLTGALIPVLIFGGWALVVVLALVFLGLLFARLFGFVFSPVTEIISDIREWVKGPKYPSPEDADFETYVMWANGEGEFAHCSEWDEVRAYLEERRRSEAIRDRLREEQARQSRKP